MKVRYTETALAEIEEIISYIAHDNPRAAGEVAAAIEKTIASAAARPASAPFVHEEVRAKLVGRYQYRVFYAVRDDELIVRNVRSTRRLRPWEAP